MIYDLRFTSCEPKAPVLEIVASLLGEVEPAGPWVSNLLA